MSRRDRGKPESIRQRLRNHLRSRGEDSQFALQRYAGERFLYRLGESRHRERFVLKGATLFSLWGGPLYRATRDLDFTGYGKNDEAALLSDMGEVCSQASPRDEIVFDPSTLTAEPIRDESEYRGTRLRVEARLGESRIPLQIDIGFGNAIHPPAREASFPTLIGDPAPRIRAYPPEAVIAEKFQAMVFIGERNTRMKDFYDLYVVAGQFEFDGVELGEAIRTTFERRKTAISSETPAPLTPAFYSEAVRVELWRGYLNRSELPNAPADFGLVGERLRAFLGPIWSGLAGLAPPPDRWKPGGPWS